VRGFRITRLLLLLLAACMAFSSAARFGFRSVPTQCPTAAVHRIAVTVRSADGRTHTEVRAPRPGETGFVACHCQEKRPVAQPGWTVPTFMPALASEPVRLDTPILCVDWVQPAPDCALADPPAPPYQHPPSA